MSSFNSLNFPKTINTFRKTGIFANENLKLLGFFKVANTEKINSRNKIKIGTPIRTRSLLKSTISTLITAIGISRAKAHKFFK